MQALEGRQGRRDGRARETRVSTAEKAPTVMRPACDKLMVRRVAGKGPNAGQPFWGTDFPRCRGTRPMAGRDG